MPIILTKLLVVSFLLHVFLVAFVSLFFLYVLACIHCIRPKFVYVVCVRKFDNITTRTPSINTQRTWNKTLTKNGLFCWNFMKKCTYSPQNLRSWKSGARERRRRVEGGARKRGACEEAARAWRREREEAARKGGDANKKSANKKRRARLRRTAIKKNLRKNAQVLGIFGGGAESRTPVHDSSLRGVFKLSQVFK